MAGGDLASAITADIAEHGTGPQRRLGWYSRGRIVLLCVARGLVYLHHRRVREARLRRPGRCSAHWAPAVCMGITAITVQVAMTMMFTQTNTTQQSLEAALATKERKTPFQV